MGLSGLPGILFALRWFARRAMSAAVGISADFISVALSGTIAVSSASSVSMSGVMIVSPLSIFVAKSSIGTSTNPSVCCNVN